MNTQIKFKVFDGNRIIKLIVAETLVAAAKQLNGKLVNACPGWGFVHVSIKSGPVAPGFYHVTWPISE